MWTSRDGRIWTQLQAPAAPPWNGESPKDMRYDFDTLVFSGGRAGLRPSIITFGDDREIAHDAMIAMNERPLWNARSNGRTWPRLCENLALNANISACSRSRDFYEPVHR